MVEGEIYNEELWFGDERGYNATITNSRREIVRLWFGDERGYNATVQWILR